MKSLFYTLDRFKCTLLSLLTSIEILLLNLIIPTQPIPVLGNRENRERTREMGEGENLTAPPGVTPVVRLVKPQRKEDRESSTFQ
jgi:hypothetical protein